MASLLTDPLLEVSGHAPPPNRTFYHFTVTKSEVIWRWWIISLRAVDRNQGPGETRQSHQEMLEDTRFQDEISMVFGREVLELAKSLCQGRFNYVEKLPDALLLRILGFLELEDVGQLLRTSRRFSKLCQSEEFWEKAVRQRCSTLPDEAASLASDIGWRRIFFTNKIQLQLLINRRQTKLQEAPEETSGDHNDTSERPRGNKSPSSTEKSESSVYSSGDERRSSDIGDGLLLSPSPDDGLLSLSSGLSSGSEEQPGGEERRPSDSPPLSLSAGHSLTSSASPPQHLASGFEDLESSVMKEFMENLKIFQLAQGQNSEEESEDSL